MLGDNCCGRIDLRSPAAASHPGRYIVSFGTRNPPLTIVYTGQTTSALHIAAVKAEAC
ncbi:hypothetical protein QTP88_002463 [Uroleucon formosanum]